MQILNRFTARPFNLAYEAWQHFGRAGRELDLFEFLFPVANKTRFFELFGKAGFHEYQMLFPAGRFAGAVARIRREVERRRVPITLASCKLFRGAQSLLRFDGSGVCLAFDFLRNVESAAFATFLDEVVMDRGGIPNVAKDSRLPREVVVRCYPEYEKFRGELARFDPRRLYRSAISERLLL